MQLSERPHCVYEALLADLLDKVVVLTRSLNTVFTVVFIAFSLNTVFGCLNGSKHRLHPPVRFTGSVHRFGSPVWFGFPVRFAGLVRFSGSVYRFGSFSVRFGSFHLGLLGAGSDHRLVRFGSLCSQYPKRFAKYRNMPVRIEPVNLSGSVRLIGRLVNVTVNSCSDLNPDTCKRPITCHNLLLAR